MNLYTKAGKEILSFLITALQIILTTYYVLVLIHSAELFTILYIFMMIIFFLSNLSIINIILLNLNISCSGAQWLLFSRSQSCLHIE
jgi:hypothetical protein